MRKALSLLTAAVMSTGPIAFANSPDAPESLQTPHAKSVAEQVVTQVEESQPAGAGQTGAGQIGATPVADEGKSPRPELRAGLDEEQMAHAVTIVKTGQEMGMPRDAYVVAIATAIQESNLRVLANVNVPESFDYQPRDGYGRDHDSVGLFQQRVSLYSVNDVKYSMDPRYSSMKFYDGLEQVDGWQSMSVSEAAQEVQGSAFPDAYGDHVGEAELIVDSILEWQEK